MLAKECLVVNSFSGFVRACVCVVLPKLIRHKLSNEFSLAVFCGDLLKEDVIIVCILRWKFFDQFDDDKSDV